MTPSVGTALVCVDDGGVRQWAVERDGRLHALDVGLADLLALPLAEARAACAAPGRELAGPARRLPPVDEQEVWAAGVTYLRSRQGRAEESDHADLYDSVYDAERPEIFFKSTAPRVVTDGDPVGIRSDSSWDVPEAEVGLVLTARGEIFGYVPGNDMSSRSIEGANALYLPQAKVYDRSCALGAAIVPVWAAGPGPFEVRLRIERAGATAFSGTTTTASMRRSFEELAGWLFRALEFPAGAVLLTGTGIVPDASFTLRDGDVVTVEVDGIGRLTNPVTMVGEGAR